MTHLPADSCQPNPAAPLARPKLERQKTSQSDGSVPSPTARRPGLELRRVNVDFASWMVESLDREARRLGVARQSVIKVWIADGLKEEAS